MATSFNVFETAFLDKVTEYQFTDITEINSEEQIRFLDGLLFRACAKFHRLCLYDLNDRDNEAREFSFDFDDDDVDEIIDIISEGMVEQWLKPYANNAENMENVINTADYSQYSPSELLNQVRTSHSEAKEAYRAMVVNYTYHHGDLTDLHL